MREQLQLVAVAQTPESGDILASLGIDWKLLVLQAIAFLILLFVLSKFVFPIITRMIDEREDRIAEGQKAAMAATKKAEEAENKIDEMMQEARAEAGDIVSTAKEQADKLLRDSDLKAKERADRIVAEAQADIEKQVTAARKTLHNETLDLVGMATEKVTRSHMTSKVDEALITDALKEAK